MKQKSKATPENIRPHLSQNQILNIRDNTHGLANCDTQNYNTQNYSCSRFVPPSASNIPAAPVDSSLKANIRQENWNVTNHESEIHYATVGPTSQSGPPSFFSRSRRKQSNLFRSLGTTVGASYSNAEIDSQKRCVDEHHPVSDSLTEGCSANSNLLKQREQTAHSGSSSDVMKGSSPHNRKRGRPCNTCKTTPVQHNCLEPNAQVHPPSALHSSSQPLQSDAICFSDVSKRWEKTIETATKYVHQQNSMVHLHPNLDTSVHDAGEGPSSNVIKETFRHTRKRGRPWNTSTSARVRRCSALRNTSPHSGQNSCTQSSNNISETLASYASPVTEMASSHATKSARQPQKRNRRTHQSSAACGNDRSQNITEGSTSYTPENTSPAYDDLGDCTECCNYCNASFGVESFLQVVLMPVMRLTIIYAVATIFRTARDKCAQADVPEFKIRLYSGDGPCGYELPSSNSLGAIVFDRGPESESNYDVVLEYRDRPVKRISKIHKSYMSLQFPLIFIYGQPGFHTKLMLRTANPDDEPKRVSMNAFYTYQLHPRHNMGSSQTAIALKNEERDGKKKDDEASEASVTLPEKKIDQGKELQQHDLQTPDKMLIKNRETSGSPATPFASPNEKSGVQKKTEETSKAPVSLPKKEVEQGKELHEHNLQTPDKMLIGTQETSGTTIEAEKCC
ncbi:hypothetical protein CTI12_AA460810 [Artemisia annua]|uniref:Helitron helicase-like domain-containing protein n=1 Tax=Artemisia annua TaxID=35608 RepID=A0A2U1LS16_ARTAN|nr:hypothetical protein CTI12_AA460810 [Artemisia annua]